MCVALTDRSACRAGKNNLGIHPLIPDMLYYYTEKVADIGPQKAGLQAANAGELALKAAPQEPALRTISKAGG